MLLYHNRSILVLILARKGSILRLRTILGALMIAGVTFFICYLINNESELAPKIPHHYGMILVGAFVSFALVYRMNLGWQRYWEAMTQQHFMYSKWSDAYAQFFAFAQVSIVGAMKTGGTANEQKVQRIRQTVDRLERNYSLLSAFAAHRLTHGDNERMEHRASDGVPWKDRIVLRRVLRVDPDVAHGTAMPQFISCGMRTTPLEAGEMPTDGDDLLRCASNAWTTGFRVVKEPDPDEWQFLSKTVDRVAAVMYWVIHDLAQISADIAIAPPIQSRMYQELSNGMLGFNNSLKIADVPFPFPYAQLLTWMLIGFTCLIPFYVAIFTTSLIMSPIAAFLACIGMWSINEVAIELENPFGSDDNDISCWDFHERFIDALLEQRGVHQCKASAQQRREEQKKEKEEAKKDAEAGALNAAAPATAKNVDLIVLPDTAQANGSGTKNGTPSLQSAPPVADALAKSVNTGLVKLDGVSLPDKPTRPGVAEVYDRQLAEITSRIETRLSQILIELETGGNAKNQETGSRHQLRGQGVHAWNLPRLGEAESRQAPPAHSGDQPLASNAVQSSNAGTIL